MHQNFFQGQSIGYKVTSLYQFLLSKEQWALENYTGRKNFILTTSVKNGSSIRNQVLCTVPTMLYGRVTFLEFQCPLSVVYRWIKPNAFNQGKFGLKSVQKFIFEPSGLHSTGLVAFQSGKVTRACKVYGICLKLLLKLRLSFSQKETSHILPCWELWGFKVQQGRT